MKRRQSPRRIGVNFIRPTKGLLWFVCIAINTILAFAVAHAQATATLQGRVVDPAGAVLAGVKVLAHHEETGLERVAQTDNVGVYQIAALPVGEYHVEVHADG